MKKRHLLLIPVLSSALILAGCASESKRFVDLNLKYMTTSSAPVNATDQKAQAQLSEAASSVGQSLQQLSAVQMATHPGVKVGTPSKAAGLQKVASLNWTGPIKPLLNQIANAANYRLRVLGNKPAVPVIVNISTPSPRPLAEILQNAKYQASGKASVSVYPKSRVIELRYNKK